MFNSAWAGPPFVTDDPEPVAYGHWEVNYSMSKTWRQARTSAVLPGVDINYGFLPDVQLHMQPNFSHEKRNTGRVDALDDTEIGVKYRFLNIEQGDSTFIAGIYPLFMLPTGSARLGPGRGHGQSFLPVWLQRNSGKWTVYGGSGYRINPGAGYKDSVYVGGTALYQFTSSLELGMELFHETPSAVGGLGTAGFTFGGNYNLARDYGLLFSVGKGVSNVSATNQYSVYSGLKVFY